MAEEPLPWSHLPGFQFTQHPPRDVLNAIVSVGFLPFGLPDLIKNDYSDAKVTLLFPFPPGPPNYQRTWEFIRDIEKSSPLRDPSDIKRIDALDVPGCFKRILELTRSNPENTVLAPYGPKPHSLAMCLFACSYNCEVYYTQPEVYHPSYSTGIATKNNQPVTSGYLVKLNHKNLYECT